MANSEDPDEVAHDEPPHLDLHSLQIQQFFILGALRVNLGAELFVIKFVIHPSISFHTCPFIVSLISPL